MERILVIMEAGKLADRVFDNLTKDYDVMICHNCAEANSRMQPMPDAMILQIELPGTDGLTFLEQLHVRPPVILAVSSVHLGYSSQKLYDLGVGYFVRTPCTAAALTDRIRDMLFQESNDHFAPQAKAARHLTVLGITPTEDGGKHLRIGLPLFAQDPKLKLSGELYPTVAKLCDTTAFGVEHDIRNAIKEAWIKRNPEIWEEYFPEKVRCPSNKIFISTLAKKLY